MCDPSLKSSDCVRRVRGTRDRTSNLITDMNYYEPDQWLRACRYSDAALPLSAERSTEPSPRPAESNRR